MSGPTDGMRAADGPFTVTPPAEPFAFERVDGQPSPPKSVWIAPHVHDPDTAAGWAYNPTCPCYLCTSSPRRRADEKGLR